MSHKHEWVLIENKNSLPKYRPLPKGQWVSGGGLFGGVTYTPGFDRQMLLKRIVETITESERPWISWQTWACNCGKVKTKTQRHPGLTEINNMGDKK